MKFLVPNYSCLQNPWLEGYRPQIPIRSVLCPQLNLLKHPPPPKKIPGYTTGVNHPPLSSAEVKKRVELYLYFPSWPSCPVIGWNLISLYLYLYVFQCFVDRAFHVNFTKPHDYNRNSVFSLLISIFICRGSKQALYPAGLRGIKITNRLLDVS